MLSICALSMISSELHEAFGSFCLGGGTKVEVNPETAREAPRLAPGSFRFLQVTTAQPTVCNEPCRYTQVVWIATVDLPLARPPALDASASSSLELSFFLSFPFSHLVELLAIVF